MKKLSVCCRFQCERKVVVLSLCTTREKEGTNSEGWGRGSNVLLTPLNESLVAARQVLKGCEVQMSCGLP